ncbi:MAG: ABC transporter ATP-binding protein/permease [Oscillospiraceae bacterium]|nr:ABC transporter ATP-binding protein/permease [Oscillospiraceae bacterium]
MKLMWRIAKEAKRYSRLLAIAVTSTFMLTGVNLAAPRILTEITRLVTNVRTDGALDMIARYTAVLLVLYLFRILFRYLSNFMAHKAAWHLVQELRQRVYDHIQSFSMGYFYNQQTGDLMSRVTNDTATFEALYAHIIPEMITNFVTIAGVVTMLMLLNVRLALLTCIPIPFILVSGWFFTKKVQPKFRAMQRSLADLNSRLHDNFNGIIEIQAFGQQERESRHVTSRLSAFTNNMLSALNISAKFHPGVEFMTSLGTVIVAGFGGYLAYMGSLEVADILGFMLYLALFYGPIAGVARLLEDFSHALAGAERVIEILDTPSGIIDLPGAKPIGPVAGEIAFDHVSFSYDPNAPVLNDISFMAKPGQMIALVGPTGVGKTTAIQLVSRFYEPDSGRVLIDGSDIKDVTLDSLRQNIALVLQDTFLFTGTIAENIGYAKPEATMDEIIEAAKIARIHDNILEMPDEYDTQVGERGAKLSGGQKQRIAIARAVLRQAPILILDEATASVDIETEAHIQQAINDLAGTRTIIAIAHRLSTIRKADMILVIENGEIVQRGSHEQLMVADGLYRRLNASIA